MIERYIIYHNTKIGEERDRYDDGEEKELLADLKSMGKAYYVYDRKEDKDYTYSQFKKKIGVRDSMTNNKRRKLMKELKNRNLMKDSINHKHKRNNRLLRKDSMRIKDSDYIYLLPSDVNKKDLEGLKDYNLKLLGVNTDEGDKSYVVKGTKANLEKYCDDYLGYIMHPDYLYKEDEFAGNIKPIRDSKKIVNRRLRKDSFKRYEALWYYDNDDYDTAEFSTEQALKNFYKKHKNDPDKSGWWLTKRNKDWEVIEDISTSDSVNKKVRQDEYYSRKENEINRQIEGRGFEMPNGDYLGIELRNGSLNAGSIANAGLHIYYSIEYDFDSSLDRNLQELYDEIINSGDYDYDY